MIFLEYLILLSPLIWELASDYIRIEKRKKEDNHVGYIAREIAVREALGYTDELLKQLGEPR